MTDDTRNNCKLHGSTSWASVHAKTPPTWWVSPGLTHYPCAPIRRCSAGLGWSRSNSG